MSAPKLRLIKSPRRDELVPRKRSRVPPRMQYVDLEAFARLVRQNAQGQCELHPKVGEAAAFRRLKRAGLIWTNRHDFGYGVTEYGFTIATVLIALMESAPEPEQCDAFLRSLQVDLCLR